MPKPRKPIEMQKGNLTVFQQRNRKTEEDSIKLGDGQLAKPPLWLIDDIAKKEYKRIVKELKSISIIGNLDKNNIGAYCNAYSNYIKATEQLNGKPYYIDRETRAGIIVVKNPLIDIQTNFATEMRKFASLCGMTIDSRLKAASTKTTRTEWEVDKRFGNI